MTENIRISVIIRTYKRRDMLIQCINELLKQIVFSEHCEVIVVNNTPLDFVEKYIKEILDGRNIPIKYYTVSIQSASKTANKGILESKGDIIAFIDDDVIPEKDWLYQVEKSFEREEVKIVGGKVLLYREKILPEWVDEPMKRMLGKIDMGGSFRKMKRKEFPVLMNFAIRREVFDQVGLFPEKLGYQENKPLAGEENAFVIAARRKGYEVYYNPDMIVYHRVQMERIKRMFFIKRKYWEGRATCITNQMFYSIIFVIFISFFRMFVVIPLLTFFFLLSCLTNRGKCKMELLCRIFRNLGYGVEALGFEYKKSE